MLEHLVSSDIVAPIMYSNFESNFGKNAWCLIIKGYKTASVAINNSNFTKNIIQNTLVSVDLSSQIVPKITCYLVQFNNNIGKKFGIVSLNKCCN